MIQGILATTNNTMIYVLYGGLCLFLSYSIFKSYKAKKSLKGDLYNVKYKMSIANIVIEVIILIIGLMNLFTGDKISGTLMVLLVVLFALEMRLQTPILSSDGIYADGEFIEWNKIKKWYTNKEDGELSMIYKEGYNEKDKFVKINPEDAEKVDQIIKKNVLNK